LLLLCGVGFIFVVFPGEKTRLMIMGRILRCYKEMRMEGGEATHSK